MIRKASGLVWRWRSLGALWRAETTNRALLAALAPARLLVVCYGNIYRSPYAAAVLRSKLVRYCEARSSGFHPQVGRSSPADVLAFAARQGFDLSDHRSAVVSPADLHWADLIVVMDRHNWVDLMKRGANQRKLFWLGTLDGDGEIEDPYGRPPAQAEAILRRVQCCTELLAAAIAARHSTAA